MGHREDAARPPAVAFRRNGRGVGAIALGLGIAAAAMAGVRVNAWLLILMPLVVIGTMLYWSRVIGPFPTGVERARPTKARRQGQDP